MAGQRAGEQTEHLLLEGRKVIRRPRLARILDRSTARGRTLVAPAGYGKTTFARQWLEDKRYAWYQGGPATMDVAALAVGLADVCSAVLPGAGDRMRARLRVSNSPEDDVEPLAELLIEDLVDWPDDVWLAFDDYQFAMASAACEEFVELLFTATTIPMLIMSRERPTWVTARRLLYGEVHELSRATLAMDEEEVSELLSAAGGKHVQGLLALADGWPAVIGLAAHTPDTRIPDVLTDALYDFFAEELLSAFDLEDQSAFALLAIANVINPGVLGRLSSTVARDVLVRGEHRGVVTNNGKGSYAIHPLLRRFLLDRASSFGVDVPEVGADLVAFFSGLRQWDEAFDVIEVASLPSLVPQLIRASLQDVLHAKRLATIERWLDFAREAEIQSPVCDIALSELECRRGNPLKAQTLAVHGAALLEPTDSLLGSALVLAGKAALLGNRTEEAIKLYDSARRVPHITEAELYEATWGQFVAAARLESPQALDLLETLESMTRAIPERELRKVSARMIAGVRMDSLRDQAELFAAIAPLLDRVADPFVRSSFLLAHAQLLALAANYPQALRAADAALADLQTHRFEFAVPHTSLVKALSHLGLRQVAQAAALVADSQKLGQERGDTYVQMHALALEARLLMHQGAAQQAAQLLSRPWPSPPEKSMQAEYFGTWALALACAGDRAAALEHATNATSTSRGIEAAVLAAAARAIVSNTQAGAGEASTLFEISERTANYDGLVLASRLSPRLAQELSSDPRRRRILGALLHAIGDYPLAKRMGIELPPRATTEQLTRREQEVYDLLAVGMTNREIAKKLFISEATAKVHSMRVREKLGLRSRTEVVLHAAQATQATAYPHSAGTNSSDD
jgi:ATP/maltotriose-dependent transcriptional regulator MalT